MLRAPLIETFFIWTTAFWDNHSPKKLRLSGRVSKTRNRRRSGPAIWWVAGGGTWGCVTTFQLATALHSDPRYLHPVTVEDVVLLGFSCQSNWLG